VTIDLLADPPPGFAVLGGDDPFVSPLLALGAHAAILASAHLATAALAELVTAWRAGDAVRARAPATASPRCRPCCSPNRTPP
jgi:4-hydroxy-tetrahydrodipicolinate synthase